MNICLSPGLRWRSMAAPGGSLSQETHAGSGDVQTATLLVAEDDEGSRLALARSLERYGYRVMEAADGESALRVFQSNPGIDLVVLDIGLPRLDGFAVLSRLRQLSDVPVIMLTGRGEEVDRVVGLELRRRRLRLEALFVTRAGCPGARSPSASTLRGRASTRRRRAAGLRRSHHRPTRTRDSHRRREDRPHRPGVRAVRVSRRSSAAGLRPRGAAGKRLGTRFQDPATVTEHIRRVRAKIEKHPPTRKVLTTLRGMGYRFDP